MNTDYEKNKDEDEDKDGGGEGGQGGDIYFQYKDPLPARVRDDLLPPHEIKRLLLVHQEQHKAHTHLQKLLLKARKDLKEGRAAGLGAGLHGGAEESSLYEIHPIQSKAQFAGVNADKKMNPFPSANNSDTNPKNKEQLQNRLDNRLQNKNQLRYQHALTPQLTPRR